MRTAGTFIAAICFTAVIFLDAGAYLYLSQQAGIGLSWLIVLLLGNVLLLALGINALRHALKPD